MLRNRLTLALGLFLVVAGGGLRLTASALADELWSIDLQQPPLWSRVGGDGSLLVATAAGTASYDGQSGSIRWQRPDIGGLSRSEIIDLGGGDLALISVTPQSKKSKRSRRKRKSKNAVWQAVDLDSGKTRWQLENLEGRLGGVVTVADQGLVVLFLDDQTGKRKQRGIYIEGRRLTDGSRLWRTKYTGSKAHLLDSPGRRKAGATDGLSHYASAVTVDGVLYIPYLGLHAYDLATGAFKWGKSFKTTTANLRRASPSPLIVGDRVYAAGPGLVVAFDKASGKEIWARKIKHGPAISELQIGGDRILARMGGLFTDGTKLQGQKPMGVVALDTATGKTRWRYGDAVGSITNLDVDTTTNRVIFADGEAVIGLRLSSGIPEFETPLQFFRLYGIFKEKSGGFSIGGGFSKTSSAGSKGGGGMLGFGKSGLNIGDLPLEALPQGREVILRGQHHIMAFDRKVRLIQWSAIFSDTGYMDGTLRRTGRLPAYSPRDRAYFMTTLETGKKRRKRQVLSLLGVNRRTGKIVSRLDLDGAKPSFLIDPDHDRLFRFFTTRKASRISAFGL